MPIQTDDDVSGYRDALEGLDATLQERLINWSYAVAMQRYESVLSRPRKSRRFPYSPAALVNSNLDLIHSANRRLLPLLFDIMSNSISHSLGLRCRYEKIIVSALLVFGPSCSCSHCYCAASTRAGAPQSQATPTPTPKEAQTSRKAEGPLGKLRMREESPRLPLTLRPTNYG